MWLRNSSRYIDLNSVLWGNSGQDRGHPRAPCPLQSCCEAWCLRGSRLTGVVQNELQIAIQLIPNIRIQFWDFVLGGAPAIASSSGAYVAGTAAESIASSNGEFEKIEKGNPHPPSTESGWRLDPMTVDSAWRLEPVPTTAYQGTTCPHLSRGKSTVYTSQDTQETIQKKPTQETIQYKPAQETIQNKRTVTLQPPQDKLTHVHEDAKYPPKDQVDKESQGGSNSAGESKDGTSKNDDEIPFGYSPGSPVPSSVSQQSGNKFDAIYHKNLGSTLFKRLIEQYELTGSKAEKGCTYLIFPIGVNSQLWSSLLMQLWS